MKMAPEDVLEEFIANADIYAIGQGDGKIIAEQEDFDVQIFLSGKQVKEFGPGIYPVVTVIASGEVLYDEPFQDEDEFLEGLAEVYETYLTPKIIERITGESDTDPPEDLTLDDREEEIELREKELDCAVADFLFMVYGEDPTVDMPNGADLLEELKDALLEACATIVDENIYRPMIFGEPDGYEEFPYADTTS